VIYLKGETTNPIDNDDDDDDVLCCFVLGVACPVCVCVVGRACLCFIFDFVVYV
jgi:hypothetical protein